LPKLAELQIPKTTKKYRILQIAEQAAFYSRQRLFTSFVNSTTTGRRALLQSNRVAQLLLDVPNGKSPQEAVSPA
jgi:hypothetical protein